MAQISKFFRVATEGATTDGRQIERAWIQQMAKNFNPKKYGARVWLEHLRGIHPESSFKAYGDVLAAEAREVEDGKLALFAQIEPLPELVAMNKAKQKIYTSIEVHPKFADNPVACRLVRIEATARRRMRPPPAAPPCPFTGFVPRALPSYDHKRAAAGDRD